jgi:predicted Rossmann fold flavoprotein
MGLEHWPVVILGAGAAGLYCALHAARRGRRVLLLDHGSTVGRKILVSGGGRCNFTNLGAAPGCYHSANPGFCATALERHPPGRFIDWVTGHRIPFHEKKLGQLFCDGPARQLLDALLEDVTRAGVRLRTGVVTQKITGQGPFRLSGPGWELRADRLVLATGGLSLPKLGASNLAYRVAEHYGLPGVPTRPALVPLTLGGVHKSLCESLAGVSAEVRVVAGGQEFRENLLFTHRGLSGPAVLQASSLITDGEELVIDWLPGRDASAWLEQAFRQAPGRTLPTLLAEVLPRRLAQALCDLFLGQPVVSKLPAAERRALAERLGAMAWRIASSEGYRTAEVTRGGVDTTALDEGTLEARSVPGLFFIGECVDVTGWLGGYNFQWAWSSGWAAAQAL